jgi:ribosomal-protein-alanine N-acetyltransferase
MHQDESVMAHLGGKRSYEETLEYFDLNIGHWKEHGYGIWVLKEIVSGALVGRGGLRMVVYAGNNEVEIAYGLLPAFWNRGFASEFARGLVDIGFEELGLAGLVSATSPENIASRRVLEKVGFSYESEISLKGRVNVLYRIHKR